MCRCTNGSVNIRNTQMKVKNQEHRNYWSYGLENLHLGALCGVDKVLLVSCWYLQWWIFNEFLKYCIVLFWDPADEVQQGLIDLVSCVCLCACPSICSSMHLSVHSCILDTSGPISFKLKGQVLCPTYARQLMSWYNPIWPPGSQTLQQITKWGLCHQRWLAF